MKIKPAPKKVKKAKFVDGQWASEPKQRGRLGQLNKVARKAKKRQGPSEFVSLAIKLEDKR